MEVGQSGDVTESEPTNLIVGSDAADGEIVGSFRADIILGRGGSDILKDGDEPGDTVWADDQLFGGAGNDTLVAGKGSDSLDGGDGTDIADYSAAGASAGTGITVTVSPDTTSEGDPILLVTDPYGKTDTLISIEHIIGTLQKDDVDLSGLQDVGVTFDALSDAEIDVIKTGSGDDILIRGEVMDGGAGYDIYFVNDILHRGGAFNTETGVVEGNAIITDSDNQGAVFLPNPFYTGPGGGEPEFLSLSDFKHGLYNAGFGSNYYSYFAYKNYYFAFDYDIAAAEDGPAANEIDYWTIAVQENTNPALISYFGDSLEEVVQIVWLENVSLTGMGLAAPDPITYEMLADALSVSAGGGNTRYDHGAAGVSPTLASVVDLGGGDDEIFAGDGDDTLTGGDGDDLVIASLGADVIVGGGGDDVYDGGDGTDSVTYAGSTQAVSVDLGAGVASGAGIGADVLVNIENVTGGAGGDVLVGDSNANVLSGGAGDDTLDARAGGDVYAFDAGFGADMISDIGNAADMDSITFGAGVLAADVTLIIDDLNADNLIVEYADGSSILVEGQFLGDGSGVEEIVFDDGAIWDRAFIDANAVSPLIRDPDQTINGTAGDDTLTGGTGHDTLKGFGGSDTYVLGVNHGDDVIKDKGGVGDIDRILFDASIAPGDLQILRTSGNFGDLFLVNTVTGDVVEVDRHFALNGTEGVEEIVFGDGTIWDRAYLAANAETQGTDGAETIDGTDADERIRGLLGDDTLKGKDGGDDYRFAAGDGNDKVDEWGLAGDIDRIVFDSDVAAVDIVLEKNSSTLNDLFLVNTNTGDVIEVDQHFLSARHGVEAIVFSDGTVWDQQFIIDNVTMTGTDGADSLTGNNDDERIRGGLGGDTLKGASGSDDYLFGANDGSDFLDEFGDANDIDRIIFDAGVAPADISLSRGAGGLANTVIATNVNTGAVITIDGQLSSTALGIEEIVFAGGTIWDRDDIETLSNPGAAAAIARGGGVADFNGGGFLGRFAGSPMATGFHDEGTLQLF